MILGEVTDIDLEHRLVTSKVLNRETQTPYDTLVVAAGSSQSYFGMDRFAEFAPGTKNIDDALELRGRIFGAFELAETLDGDEETIERLLTFVVIGACPTGVEADRCRAGPRGPHPREARSDAAGPPLGRRGRRHDRL